MGKVILPDSGRIYTNANPVIHHVEKIEPYRTASSTVWEAVDEGRSEVETSELTLLEVLVKPLREGNYPLAALFRELLLGAEGVTCLPIDRETLGLAAQLRGLHGLRTPDVIHAATALRSGASLFLTDDRDFLKVPGLNVAILGEIAAS